MTKNQEKTKEALERIDNAIANIDTDADARSSITTAQTTFC